MATQIVEDEQAPVVQASSHAVLVVKPGLGQSNLPLIEGAFWRVSSFKTHIDF